jgi:hypothetical protein
MWGIATKKIGRVAVKEQGKSDTLLFTRSLTATMAQSTILDQDLLRK